MLSVVAPYYLIRFFSVIIKRPLNGFKWRQYVLHFRPCKHHLAGLSTKNGMITESLRLRCIFIGKNVSNIVNIFACLTRLGHIPQLEMILFEEAETSRGGAIAWKYH
jgi:hypothetical protein